MYKNNLGKYTAITMCFLVFCVFFVARNVIAGDAKNTGSAIVESIPDKLNISAASPAAAPCVLKPVYRFYNVLTTGHFFTMSEAEKSSVIANLPQFQYEGIGYYAFDNGTCSLGGGTSTPVIPQAGTWKGAILSFNVSSDGTSLTSTGSSLYTSGLGYASLKAVISGTNCTTVTISSNSTIPITNNAFTKSMTWTDGSSFNAAGQFSSATSSTGTYSYTGISGECSGSGTWSITYY